MSDIFQRGQPRNSSLPRASTGTTPAEWRQRWREQARIDHDRLGVPDDAADTALQRLRAVQPSPTATS